MKGLNSSSSPIVDGTVASFCFRCCITHSIFLRRASLLGSSVKANSKFFWVYCKKWQPTTIINFLSLGSVNKSRLSWKSVEFTPRDHSKLEFQEEVTQGSCTTTCTFDQAFPQKICHSPLWTGHTNRPSQSISLIASLTTSECCPNKRIIYLSYWLIQPRISALCYASCNWKR